MFKVIEIRFDELTGNESEHILLKTRFEWRANERCKEANATFAKPWRKRQLHWLQSWATVVKVMP